VKSKLEMFVQDVDRKDKEPAIKTGIAVAALAGAFVSVLNVFFPKLMTEEAKTALFQVLLILIPFVTAFLIRRKVWSPASVDEIIEEAVTTEKEFKQQRKDRNI